MRFDIAGPLLNGLVFTLCLIQTGLPVQCVLEGSEQSPGYFDDTDVFYPPLSKDNPYPQLLHERDVIHYVNSEKEFVHVGSGVFGDVTLGELRDTGAHVVIKKFVDSSVIDIMMEVKMHRYAEKLGFSPRLIGLLPSGPMSGNISLVYEYISHARCLVEWIDDFKDPFTPVQWLTACRQIIQVLQGIHGKHIIFNDFHSGNILIQRVFDQIKVYLIDFGFSTYHHGKIYHSGYGTISYLAPELWDHVNRTTTSVDVYSFGNNILKIAEKINSTRLYHLGHWCKASDPFDRPSLSQILTKVEGIFFEVKILDYAKRSSKKQQIIFSWSSASHFNRGRSFKKTSEDSLEWEWLTTSGAVLSKKCPQASSVLFEKDLNFEDDFEDPDLTFRVARLNFTNQVVFVKDFQSVEFDKIAEEACVTSLLAKKGVAPAVVGILFQNDQMSEASLAMEKFGQGVTVPEFVLKTAGEEWDTRSIKQALKTNHDMENFDEVEEIVRSFTRYSSSAMFNYFLDDIVDFTSMSKLKSHRQRYLEIISSLMIKHLKRVHLEGLLVNNFAGVNVILKLDKHKGVDARLVNLGETSSLGGVAMTNDDPDNEFSYSPTAPEVLAGHETSTSSDVYSLCTVLYWMMESYFTAYEISAEYRSQFTRIEVDVRRNNSTSETDHNLKIGSSSSNQGYCQREKVDLCNTKLLYRQYQNLLLQCLHSSPENRPHIQDIDNILKQIIHSG